MKIRPLFKSILLLTLFVLYSTGIFTWVFSHWFQIDRGIGPEAPPLRIWLLDSHSIVSLWFFVLFGYLFHSHIEPNWKSKKKRKSGVILVVFFILLFLTVPCLFYATREDWRSKAALIHTSIGIIIVIPFIFHLFSLPEAYLGSGFVTRKTKHQPRQGTFQTRSDIASKYTIARRKKI